MTPTFGSAPSGTRPHKTTPALSLVDFSASYGGRNVLSGVTVDIPSAALAAVVGPNGAGKSTLVKAALGLVPSTQGRVRLLGQPLSRVRRKVAYVPQQDSVTKDFPITAVQVVEMGRYPHRGWWRRLTPTQRQRVFLARALAQRAELVVLDEPFTAVDARTESALLDVLTNLCREGVSVIVVHHDLRTVLRRFDHAVLLAGGVVADGPVADVLTAENLERAYGIAPLVLDS